MSLYRVGGRVVMGGVWVRRPLPPSNYNPPPSFVVSYTNSSVDPSGWQLASPLSSYIGCSHIVFSSLLNPPVAQQRPISTAMNHFAQEKENYTPPDDLGTKVRPKSIILKVNCAAPLEHPCQTQALTGRSRP